MNGIKMTGTGNEGNTGKWKGDPKARREGSATSNKLTAFYLTKY